MQKLKSNTTIKQLQKYILEIWIELGFDRLNATQRCLMLWEEVWELFKSIRKHEKIKIAKDSTVNQIEDELADVLKQVCAVANYFEIDLEKAFTEKEKKNIWRWE